MQIQLGQQPHARTAVRQTQVARQDPIPSVIVHVMLVILVMPQHLVGHVRNVLRGIINQVREIHHVPPHRRATM